LHQFCDANGTVAFSYATPEGVEALLDVPEGVRISRAAE
jgi:hypothetical protein